MFVRFRKVASDGKQPTAAKAKIACKGWYGRFCYDACHRKPRCRWLIGLDEGVDLVPYRLNVSLVENSRATGKVKQEHIASLGSIEGAWLWEFYADAGPHVAAAVTVADWPGKGAAHRAYFWECVEDRLSRLVNRLGADDVTVIRAAIHKRIPRPSQEEKRAIELAKLQDNYKTWKDLNDMQQKWITAEGKHIERAKARIKELESDAAESATGAMAAASRLVAFNKK